MKTHKHILFFTNLGWVI